MTKLGLEELSVLISLLKGEIARLESQELAHKIQVERHRQGAYRRGYPILAPLTPEEMRRRRTCQSILESLYENALLAREEIRA